MNTAPLPEVPSDEGPDAGPTRPITPVERSSAPLRRPPDRSGSSAGRAVPPTQAFTGTDPTQPSPAIGRGTRFAETLGGLFGAGALTLGVVLLVLQVAAPAVLSGATGPGWGPVAAHLAVGAVAEGLRAARHRLAVPLRVVVAIATVVAVVAVLALCWWW